MKKVWISLVAAALVLGLGVVPVLAKCVLSGSFLGGIVVPPCHELKVGASFFPNFSRPEFFVLVTTEVGADLEQGSVVGLFENRLNGANGSCLFTSKLSFVDGDNTALLLMSSCTAERAALVLLCRNLILTRVSGGSMSLVLMSANKRAVLIFCSQLPPPKPPPPAK